MNKKLLNEIKNKAGGYFEKHSEYINKAHGWDHVERVIFNCQKILKIEKADRDTVLVAAYLHDVGRIYDREGVIDAHAYFSWRICKEDVLPKYERRLGKEKIKNILNIIRFHGDIEEDCPKEIFKMIEFKILTDADKIDMFGPIGIMRAPYDPRFRTIESQLEHIKKKSNEKVYKLFSDGGKKLGKNYQEFLQKFTEFYNKQAQLD